MTGKSIVPAHTRKGRVVRTHSRSYRSYLNKGQRPMYDSTVKGAMHKFKAGELTTYGKEVTDRKQAIAMALSKAKAKFNRNSVNYHKK